MEIAQNNKIMKSDNQPAIEVSNLTKHYGEVVAVNDISFQVGNGELFGFLGPNGAGKTTTVNLFNGAGSP
jgi:ABC-2 type transport system ATP-binding protein